MDFDREYSAMTDEETTELRYLDGLEITKRVKPTGEIMLVIDNSKSMTDNVTDTQTREDLVIDSAKTLINKILKDNTQLKVGAVSFSTNSDISKEGTAEDAQLISELTNDSSKLTSAISNILNSNLRQYGDIGDTSEYISSTSRIRLNLFSLFAHRIELK